MKNYSKLTILTPLIIAVAFILGFFANSLMDKKIGFTDAERKFQAILNVIQTQYVDEISTDSLLEAAYPILMSSLDPHSAYIPASQLQAVNEELEGSFSGVGVQFAIQNDTIVVIEAISGGPGEQAGLQAGDRIIAVDGDNVAGIGITNEDVFKRLRGEKDSTVLLKVKHYNSKKPVDITVTRGDVSVSSIDAAYMATDKIGYVRVNKFGTNTYSEFYDALSNLKANGATDFVIDLRSNTGGFMEMAILMVNEFLDSGTPIVFTRGRDSVTDEYVISDGYGSFKNARVAVLIDEISASSSEIFAGAVQDNDRGLIIGRRSFGKGLVQRQIDLPDGSALRLTIARYYTPSGRCIQKDYSDLKTYENDIVTRYNNGEFFDADSIRFDDSNQYFTTTGRTVYGGGGIMPDIFVPNDTAGVTHYYMEIANDGLLNKYAIEFVDMNRTSLEDAIDVADLLQRLPSDYSILRSFVSFASQNKVPARWSQINISHNLIVNQLKALIARDIIGMDAYFEIINASDPTVKEAIRQLQTGKANFPINGKTSNQIKGQSQQVVTKQ